jgi:curved DNA-binding protein CbpA
VLHTLTEPRFGKREATVKVPTREERHRQVLGLPFDRGLSAAEIHLAFKRAAKRAHPDGGGNAGAFLELTTARDALMHPGKK